MKSKIFVFVLMMASFGELKAQEKIEILLVPNIKQLLTFKSPEEFANETRNAGYDLIPTGELENELSIIKNRFSNQPVFLGIGYSMSVKDDKLKEKVSKVFAEVNAIEELEKNIKISINQNNVSTKFISNGKRCYDNIYKLVLGDKKNNIYIAMIMLQKDTLYNSSCRVDYNIVSSTYLVKEKSGKDSFHSETSLLFSKSNQRSIYLQMSQKEDKVFTSLRDSSKEGDLKYTNNGIDQAITFTPYLNK